MLAWDKSAISQYIADQLQQPAKTVPHKTWHDPRQNQVYRLTKLGNQWLSDYIEPTQLKLESAAVSMQALLKFNRIPSPFFIDYATGYLVVYSQEVVVGMTLARSPEQYIDLLP
jgi:hypothetical protein